MTVRAFSSIQLREGIIELSPEEAHHLVHVRRAKAGDSVELFDARGWTAQAILLESVGDQARVQVITCLPPCSERPRATLAVAFPKGERQKWMLEKCVELGVATLVPLITRRGVALATDGAHARWERQIIAACKQSGRDATLELLPPVDARDFFAAALPGTKVLADPRGAPLSVADLSRADFVACVGPEGGWAPEELEVGLSHGWILGSFADHVLRVETAVVALAAIHSWAARSSRKVT